MMNPFVQRMTTLPGRYAVTSVIAWVTQGGYFLVDVDENGKVWQLNEQCERDGELLPDGWVGNEIILDARVL